MKAYQSIDIVTASVQQLSTSQLAEKIAKGGREHGVVLLEDLDAECSPPYDQMRALSEKLEQDKALAARVNACYGKRQIYKDASLKAENRLEALNSVPGLVEELGEPFVKDKNFNYRCIDYFPVKKTGEDRHGVKKPLRCGEHRDFGSFALVFPDATPGLQVFMNGEWMSAPCATPRNNNVAILTFGWCAGISSNNALYPSLHRVVDDVFEEGVTVPRRTSAVFFVAPDMDLVLAPIKRNEKDVAPPQYNDNLRVWEFKRMIAPRWRKREGSDDNAEDGEGQVDPCRYPTQDEIVRDEYATEYNRVFAN
eukprot:Nk52_evm17s2367 gene=Nk52_evmTU17s2367